MVTLLCALSALFSGSHQIKASQFLGGPGELHSCRGYAGRSIHHSDHVRHPKLLRPSTSCERKLGNKNISIESLVFNNSVDTHSLSLCVRIYNSLLCFFATQGECQIVACSKAIPLRHWTRSDFGPIESYAWGLRNECVSAVGIPFCWGASGVADGHDSGWWTSFNPVHLNTFNLDVSLSIVDSGLSSDAVSFLRFLKGPPDKDDANDRGDHRADRGQKHIEGPERHFSLSGEIILGSLVFLTGLYSIYRALHVSFGRVQTFVYYVVMGVVGVFSGGGICLMSILFS